jgi:uncharacterized protein YndB with AHSA1/START domain
MFSVTDSLEIACPPEKLFAFLTEQEKLMQWFAPQVITVPVEGTVAAFAFEYDLDFKMEIIKLVDGERVEWECVDGYGDWLGSKVSFVLKKNAEGSVLEFEHTGLKNDAKKEKTTQSWGEYLKKLKNICENR